MTRRLLVDGEEMRSCTRPGLLMGSRNIGKGGITVVRPVIDSLIVGYILARR